MFGFIKRKKRVEQNEEIQNTEKEIVENKTTEKETEKEITKEIIEETPEKIPEKKEEKPIKKGYFASLKKGLAKTGAGFSNIFLGKKEINDDLLEDLETALLVADVGMDATKKIIDEITTKVSRKELKDSEAVVNQLKISMNSILKDCEEPLDFTDKKPFVLLMVGINGAGKTTTIGKIAKKLKSDGKSVMLAAGDTFRAAAVEQLKTWGERNEIPVIAQDTGSDSASVIFDACESAKAKNIDVLIADTAGRLHTQTHLMAEIEKVVRVIKKKNPDAPHEIMLVIDAGNGQNALNQAKEFNKALKLSGITITKLDGTAKGGIIFSIAENLNLPVRFIGVGEGIDDLKEFKADDFIDALLEGIN